MLIMNLFTQDFLNIVGLSKRNNEDKVYKHVFKPTLLKHGIVKSWGKYQKHQGN